MTRDLADGATTRVEAETLRRFPLFREIQVPALEAIAAFARLRRYAAHTVVVRQDDPGDGAYLVNSGLLSVSMAASDGRITTIAQMGPGEIFGEIALLDGGPRSATVEALTESDLVTVDRAHFLQLIQNEPAICLPLVSVLAQRLRSLTRWADDTVGLSVSARLAKRLLGLIAEVGQQTGPKRFRLGVKLSQTDLGTRVGATRESVNKYLRRWERGHILEQEAGHLVIVDLERLQGIADL